MRKVLLVIVLVGAAFSGGAVVNGPGLRRAQTVILSRMGIAEEKGPEIVVADGKLAGPAPFHEDVPSTPIPPLDLEPVATQVARKPKPIPDPPAAMPETSEELVNTPLPPLSPAPGNGPAPPALEPLATSKERERDALVLAATTATDDDTPRKIPDIPADWAAVRRELKALGVSRYGTDSEPRGKARFHCVIPLAGRRAVGQHFEAEGDDELQAARAAIQRVALWRATEADGAR